MILTGTTPVDKFDEFYVKREDLAYWQSLSYPSGSKVRQYFAMAKASNNNPPCIVGCSANSAQQIYVAATAKILNTKGIIYTARRKVKSDATKYAESLGAEINEIHPGYLNNVRKAFRHRAISLKEKVAWDRDLAIRDTVEQCKNIPEEAKRIIVPTGSGLTAAGVLVGVAKYCPNHEVVAVCTSPMASAEAIHRLAASTIRGLEIKILRPVTIIPPSVPYDTPIIETLPDDTPLDPFYGAKAFKYIEPDDLLWPPGLRPVISMPEICRKAFKDWKGPKIWY